MFIRSVDKNTNTSFFNLLRRHVGDITLCYGCVRVGGINVASQETSPFQRVLTCSGRIKLRVCPRLCPQDKTVIVLVSVFAVMCACVVEK